MEKIPIWIIPIPLDDRCKFSVRVLTSWISLSLALGLIIFIAGIAGIQGGTASGTDLTDALVASFVAFPSLIFLFGVIGVVFSSTRGEEPYYPGWYWYLFPFVIWITVSWLMFGFFIGLIGLLIGAPGVKLPDLPKPSGRPSKDSVGKKESHQFLDEHEKQIEKVIQETRNKNDLESLSLRERILTKLRKNPDALLEEILTEEEMEELLEMIIEALL